MSGIKLISLNVRGIRERVKRKAIFDWVNSKKGNVVMLQETYSTPDIEEEWKRDWGGQMFFSHGSNHSRGVLVLLSQGLNFKIDHVTKDNDGRFVVLKGDLLGYKLLLGNVYFPTRERVNQQISFLEKLDNCFSDLNSSNYSLVVGGDFNIIMNKDLDYMGPSTNLRTNFTKELEMFLRKTDLIDIWRKRNPMLKQFTFRQIIPLVQSRLDYWFISKGLENKILSCDIVTSVAPDHSGIFLELKPNQGNIRAGKSYWKFNNSLCLDKEFVQGMCEEIKNIETKWLVEFDTKSSFWDFLKMKMRSFAITYSKKKSKKRRLSIEQLENEIKALERELLLSPNRDKIIKDINYKKGQLKKLYNVSMEGLKVRSRADWYEEGEQNKEYFEQLLKSNKKKTIIQELRNEKGEVIKENSAILQIIKRFYENLYAENTLTHEQLRENVFFKDIPQLSEESRNSCEGNISKDECLESLKSMKLNKSPGNDGFTVEFYLTFWPQLGGLLAEVFNESFGKGCLATSQKQGVITLIEKEGKDQLCIKNYRPITLLNTDYKILSKIMAKRIMGVLNEIIHSDQVGYIKGRYIGEALRLIDDMIFHCSKSCDEEIFLIAVDFEKAFDSVSHNFLFKVLELFGFGQSFCSWVKTMYNGISSCVMNGGFSTGYFDIKRGVRQGDPLSPYLFLLAIEILAQVLRKDNIIKGVHFDNFEVRQILYADDMTLFVQNVRSITRIQEIFKNFFELSGLKVNIEKTNVMLIGKKKGEVGRLPMGNLVTEIKILGVYFSLDMKTREELNYKEILSKIKRLLGWWKQRDLTVMGKVHLLKTYALSKLNYVSSSLVVPKWVVAEINKICFEFIWKGKDRIKRAICYQDYCDGGIKMTNFELFIKTQRIMWLKRLLYGEKRMGWKLYFDYSLRTVGGRFIFLCNYDTKLLELKTSRFYFEILRAWQDIEHIRQFKDGRINPIFFSNKEYLIRGKMIFHADLFDKNIYLVEQILENDQIKAVTYFQNLGLCSENIVKIWKICDVILKSGKYKGNVYDFDYVDIQEYNISLKIFENITLLKNLPSRKLYDHFITNLQESYTLRIKDNDRDFVFSKKEITNIFLRPRSTTLLTKVREFQYKLLHGAIYTKEHLFRFGFVDDNLCSFCGRVVETYNHIFWDCVLIKPLWKKVIEGFETIDFQNTEWKDIHIGIEGKDLNTKCCNTVIFILKYIIFLSRSEEVFPTHEAIFKKILEYRNEEKEIALKRNKLGLHLLKWENVAF